MRHRQTQTVNLLETHRKKISRCVRCGACSAVCPVFLKERRESQSARGRMALIQAVLDGQLAVSAIFKDRLATCTGCLACETSCPSGVPVTEIIQAAKEQAIAGSGTDLITAMIGGVLRHPAVFRATAWLAPVALHYSKERRARGEALTSQRSPDKDIRGQAPCTARNPATGNPPRFAGGFVREVALLKGAFSSSLRGSTEQEERRRATGRIVFFPGCAITGFQQDIGRSAKAVLGRLGCEVVVPENLKCCGRPLLSLGDRRAAEEHAEHNAAIFEAIKADAIVTACASCSLTFKKEYPTLLRSGRKAPSVLDIHEFLHGEIGRAPLRPVRKRVTWHDPCHLGRGQGLSGKARDILRFIPGIEFVEMDDADRCCGFGGVMRITHCGLSDGIAEAKVRNILATGAAIVVTGCPGCRMQIGNALRRSGSDVEVLHTVQLLAEAMGIADPRTTNASQNAECEILMQTR